MTMTGRIAQDRWSCRNAELIPNVFGMFSRIEVTR